MAERVLKVVHPSRTIYIKGYLIALVFLGIWASVYFNFIPTLVPEAYKIYTHALVVLAVISAGISEFKRLKETYTFTTNGMIHRTGIFQVSEASVPWFKLNQYRVVRTLLDKFRGSGSLEFMTSSGTITTKKLSGISKIEKIVKKEVEDSQNIPSQPQQSRSAPARPQRRRPTHQRPPVRRTQRYPQHRRRR